jgi:hypothetical protein
MDFDLRQPVLALKGHLYVSIALSVRSRSQIPK